MGSGYRNVREVTSKEMQCSVAACPAIYEAVREVTPEKMRCISAACSSVYKAKKNGKKVYLVVGRNVNPADAGLAGKVGEGEGMVEIPRELIDGMRE